MRKIKWFQDPDQFYAVYNQLMGSRPKLVLSAHLFYSLPLEDTVYKSVCGQVPGLSDIIERGKAEIPHFENIMRDLFQSLYSLQAVCRPAEELTESARFVSLPIFDALKNEAHFARLHAECCGRAKLAGCAILEFADRILADLRTLAPSLAPEKPAAQILEHKSQTLQQELARVEKLRRQYEAAPSRDRFLRASKALARAYNTAQQITDLRRLNEEMLAGGKSRREHVIRDASQAAQKHAQELCSINTSWGMSASGRMEQDIDLALVEEVRSNDLLCRISKYLGSYRQLLEARASSAYTYHSGEKYDITLGKDLRSALPSELAYLSHPVSMVLLFDKLSRGLLRQYKKRERVTIGEGDVIICIDESGSMRSHDKDAWSKAIACVLVEHAVQRKRNAAIIRFARAGSAKSYVFRHDSCSRAELMHTVSLFFGGGTDYVTPLTEAVSLLDQKCVQRADIVFITDGVCSVHREFCTWLHGKLAEHKASVLGVLLDRGKHLDFTLAPFCKQIFRTSEMEPDRIAHELTA